MINKLKQFTGIASLEGQWLRRRYFDAEVLTHVAERIKQSESGHTGELVVAIEASMPKHEPNPRLRALEVYGRLGVWDTPLNSGMLLYLALDKRVIEIVADRGITVPTELWQQVCARFQARLAKADYIDGLLDTVDEIELLLKAHTPQGNNEENILANEPVLL